MILCNAGFTHSDVWQLEFDQFAQYLELEAQREKVRRRNYVVDVSFAIGMVLGGGKLEDYESSVLGD